MKKQLAFLTFILCFNFVASAQNKPYKFGISLNPNYSYRVYTNDEKPVKDYFDSLHIGKFSYSIGLFVEKQISKRKRFRIGLNFMNTGFKTINRAVNSSDSIFNGSFNPFVPYQYRMVFNNNYLEIPIDYRYSPQPKQPLFFSFGIAPSFNISNRRVYIQYFENNTVKRNKQPNDLESYNKFGLALQFGLGYEIKLSSKIRIDIQPRFQYFLTHLFESSYSANDRLFNTGLQIDIKI